MNKQLGLGQAFNIPLYIHTSWIWFMVYVTFALVWFDIEPRLEALVTTLLMFGSVLAPTLGRMWVSQSLGLDWKRVVVFVLGGVVERPYRSKPHQEMQIEVVGLTTSALLVSMFALLWRAFPEGTLGVELGLLTLFNSCYLIFSTLNRLSPAHDNLLHGLLSFGAGPSVAQYTLTFIHAAVLVMFAASSVVLLGMGWLLFVGWFLFALMLSQLTTVAERMGEYRESMIYRNDETILSKEQMI